MSFLKTFWKKSKQNLLDKFALLFESKSKLNITIDIIALLSFFAAFLSIPLCSFRAGLNKITWLFTIIFLMAMLISIILFGKIQIDKLSFSIILFVVWTAICTFVNIKLHDDIVFTPILLMIFTCLTYIFISQNKQYRDLFVTVVFLSILIFTLSYVIFYFDELKSLNFKRLGENFGDINDIAICFGIGFAICFSLIFNLKFNIIKVILLFITLLLLGLCGLSTGSKIFLLIICVTSLFTVIKFMNKKHLKWYFYILIILGLVLLFILIINLPAFETIKRRLLDFLNPKSGDQSTSLRLQMFIDGFYMFLRRPLFGFGSSGYFTSSSIGGCWSHNNFSELLCSYGLIGFILFYIPYFLAIRSKKENKNKYLNDVGSILMVTFICCMFTVALESQKVFAYSIPIFYSLYDSNPVVLFDIKKFKKKENV